MSAQHPAVDNGIIAHSHFQDKFKVNYKYVDYSSAYVNGTSGTASPPLSAITVPSYLIALENIDMTNSVTRNCIEVNIYENYECILTQNLNAIAKSTPMYISPQLIDTMRQITLDENLRTTKSPQTTKDKIISLINKAKNLYSTVAPVVKTVAGLLI